MPGLHLKSLRGPGPILTTGHRQQAYGRDYNKLTSLALTRIPPVHHLLAGHGRRHKNALFMQCPYDLDIDAGNEVCASLLGIDQMKEGGWGPDSGMYVRPFISWSARRSERLREIVANCVAQNDCSGLL